MKARVRIGILMLVLAGALALTPFRPLKISGRSMEPTLRSGETYLLDTCYWRFGGLRRNDIVVVDRGEEKWVKRLVGLPGDRLQLTYRDDGWITFVANLSVNPGLARQAAPDGGFVQTRQVARDELFVIGDNLNRSSDSTNQEMGAFKLAGVVGIVRTFTFRREFLFQSHK